MTPVRRLTAHPSVALLGDAAGAGAIVVLLIAALHLPALL